MNASEIAKSLAAKFLENGNYELAGGALGREASLLKPSPSDTQAIEDYFYAEEGIAGLSVDSVGYTAGAPVERVVIYISRGSRKLIQSLPKTIDDKEVIVRVMGRVRPGPAMAKFGPGELFERNGRIACGSSCAPSNEQIAGTFGAMLTDGQQLFAVSNNHVLARCNHTAIGMHVASPSNIDSKAGRRAPTPFATYDRMIELRSGDPFQVERARLDAALALVTRPEVITSWQGDDSIGYDTPSTVVQPAAEMRVKKIGRTTGLTTGVIDALQNTPWLLPYKTPKFTAHVWFEDTWTIRSDEDGEPFALGGDSGSLVVTEDGSGAVGLLFATSNSGEFGHFAPLADVLNAFGSLQLVSGHGLS